jgi:hypothetical protein
MSLIDRLDGARLVVVDEDFRVAYAWFGGAGVNVYDEDGKEIYYFTVGADGPLTPEIVQRSIRGVIEAEHSEDETD